MRIPLFFALALAVALAAGACGGDDSADPSTSPKPTATTTVQASQTATATPNAGDSKSPQPEESGAPGGTPAETAPGEIPTRRATPEGTSAVAPEDQTAFIARFAGQEVVQAECGYDPSSAGATCPGYGLFALEPPMEGQDITCAILVVTGQADAIFCRSIAPQATLYYDIQ